MKELTYEQSLQLRFRMLRISDIRRHEISIYSRRQHGGRLGFGEKKKSYSKYFFLRILSNAATLSAINPTTSVLESEAQVRFQLGPRGKLKTFDIHIS